jgi:hypothetical protein
MSGYHTGTRVTPKSRYNSGYSGLNCSKHKEIAEGGETTFRITKKRRTSEWLGQVQVRTVLDGALQDTRARKYEDVEKDSSDEGIDAPQDDKNSSQSRESTMSDESDIPEKSLSQPAIPVDRSV